MGEIEEEKREKVPLSHVRLFRKEFLESGRINEAFIDKCEKFLSFDVVEILKKLFTINPGLARKFFFRQIRLKHPKESGIIIPIIERCYGDDTEVLSELRLENLKNASKERYLKIFSDDEFCAGDTLSTQIRPQPFIKNLAAKYGNRYEKMIKKVEALLKDKEHDAAACQILRSMPKIADDDEDDSWWLHLLDICDMDPHNRACLVLLDVDYRNIIDMFRAEQRAKRTPAIQGKDEVMFDETISDLDREFRGQEPYMEHRETVDENLIDDPDKIVLRDYQEEQMEGVRKGNTIVCAPTGSGKTIIAAQTLLEHFKENEKARAVMFVPTIPLVEQQAQLLTRFLRKRKYILTASGAERVVSLGRKMLSADVVVITPQLFYNYMTDPRESERIYISDFTLFIFDECHHCDSNHPYRKITKRISAFEGKKPHVVGLTASVGR
ncbi:hypothetical protein L596_016535 [Steinernema carpocapsae]|uniref:Helicase ATP-binding domain-containing protein n=1 Tax=Steinernema carpocapsae TaxID=34508 RepID=A0A4U5NJF0_STECR|nr:hypothetical protein L596_016535 [Steinernema carpocapsae]